MQDKEKIIILGKMLAEEQRRGYDDGAVVGGIDALLYTWRTTAPNTLSIPAIQHVFSLLDRYASLSLAQREERLTHALEHLRGLFRTTPSPMPETPPIEKTKVKKATTKKATTATLIVGDMTLHTPLKQVPEVGRAAAAFSRLGVKTVEDVLYHFPHRYDDYSSQRHIADLVPGNVETIVGRIDDVRTFRLKREGSIGIEVLLEDGTGTLKVVFFGNQWLLKQFVIGRTIVVSGKVLLRHDTRQMSSPDWEPFTNDDLIHTGRLVPVHSLTKGLHERNARRIIKQVVDRATPMVVDHLPDTVRERAGLLPLADALRYIHFPDNWARVEQARQRLGFDEFFFIQLGVIRRRILWQSEYGYALGFHEDVHHAFLKKLPFALTGAQERSLNEIFADIAKHIPMARLLQGDVGSGKTAVAAGALLQAIANGLQGAIMAPTEVLAEQHYRGLRALLSGVPVRSAAPNDDNDNDEQSKTNHRTRVRELQLLLGMLPEDDCDGRGVRVALLTGSLGKKDRRRVLDAIAQGDVDLIVGTHALITEGVTYHALGMICIDEQHRFGVEQRERLKQKGFNPHMLVMTATPIPRSLTLTVYGELDVSLLDEMPPGRQIIKTRWIRGCERDKAYRHVRKEIEKGRQAFVICPLVEESEKLDAVSAQEMYDTLQHDVFPDLRVGMVHGRLLPREKDAAMQRFSNGNDDILVATAVVEVGIDVPNASTIVIEGADRFGLAQLHQFRGRVGRGAHQSYCILISDGETEQTEQRLHAMEQFTDGFKLAELDLTLRGPGEFLGTRQSGTPDLKVASLTDTRLLHSARREAQAVLHEDPTLAHNEHALLRKKVERFWDEARGAS